MNPTVQNPNTPRYDITSGLLTDYGRSLGLKEVNKPITSSDLQSKQGLQLPKAPTNFESPVVLPVEQKTPAQLEQERLSTQKENESSGIQKLMTLIGTESGKEAKYATEAGADEAQKEYDRYATELTAEQRSVELAKRALSGKGLTQAQIASESEALDRQSIQKQADIAILGNAAKGRFDTAMAIAKRKVESSIRPLQAQLDAKKFVFENNKDLYTKAELSKLDTLIKADELKVKKEEDRLTKGNEMIINALQGKAPIALVEKARTALSKGGSIADVTSILGSYSMTLADRLDNQLKQAQIAKIGQEISLKNKEVNTAEATSWATAIASGKAKLSDVPKNLKASVVATLNTIQNPTDASKINTLNDKISVIDTILANKGGLRGVVGPNKLARSGLFNFSTFTGSEGDFIAGVNQLTNQETLTTLLELKKAGGTLGALSEGEGKLLREAATKINSWAKKDKNGNIYGYKTTEDAFKKELNTLKKYTQRAIDASGGASYSSMDNYLDTVDEALQVSNNPYSQAGYQL